MICPSKDEICKVVFGESVGNYIIEHIKKCSNCSTLFNEYKTLWNDLSQLQNVGIPYVKTEHTVQPNDDSISVHININKKHYLITHFALSVLYILIFLPIFIYFYHKNSAELLTVTENDDIFYVSIYKLSDNTFIKKYETNLKKILLNINETKWFSNSINWVFANYVNDINYNYKKYFAPFIEKLKIYSNDDFKIITTNFKSLYELTIFFYYISQELKIKKLITATITQQDIKFLNSMMNYLNVSQNSDGGFGIYSADQKSLPQTLFWISLFIRNYVILTDKVPTKTLNKIKNYIKINRNVISEFISAFLFGEKPDLNIHNMKFEYIEEILSSRFIYNIYNINRIKQHIRKNPEQSEISIFM